MLLKCHQSFDLRVIFRLEADIFSGIPRDGKQNRYESRDWDGRGKYLIGSGRDRE